MPLNNLESSGRRRKPSEGLAGNPYPTLGDAILFQPRGRFVVFQTCLLQYRERHASSKGLFGSKFVSLAQSWVDASLFSPLSWASRCC